MNGDGSGQTNLTGSVGTLNTQPDWSPDGTRIVFTSNRTGGNVDIWVMDASGVNPIRLTSEAAIDDQPVWSPDGTQITFTSNRDGGDFDIFTMSANGAAPTNVTNGVPGVQDAAPSWQPIVTDLVLTMTDSPDPVAVGQTLSYTVAVQNAGPVLSSAATVVVTLPTGVTSALAGPSQGSCDSVVSGQISCDLGSLAVGATATIQVTFTTTTPGTLAASAIVSAAADRNQANNSASVSTTVGMLTPTPTMTPTPTLTPIPTATQVPSACSPRPPVEVRTARQSSDRLTVAVLATTPAGTTGNRLRSIRLVATENAIVVTSAGPRTAPFTFDLQEDPPLGFNFAVQRLTDGPFLVRLVVEDGCGEWPTFVGAGPGL
jgi:uncharacterized repeat protein (TIGR01451 family)